MKRVLILLSFIGIFSFGAKAQTTIRSVDFKNFTYEIALTEGEAKETITVKNGNFEREDEDGRFYFGVIDVAYGDLNGDGAEEAAVGIIINTGGTGNFSSGFIYTMKGKKPTVLAEFEGGDRAYGGLDTVKIEGGLLIVGRNAPGENGGACCPEFIDTSKYRLAGTKLTKVGKAVRRDIYPAERISFKKGTSLSTFLVKFDKNDLKRFVVGARKGQTLLLSSTADPATSVGYDLRRGKGEVESGPNGIIVKLQENGDYVVEIANATEEPLEVSVTIEIK